MMRLLINKKYLPAFLGSLILATLMIGSWLASSKINHAPDIKLTLTDGRHINLEQHRRNRPVLVTFWAPSCISCIHEIPHLITLYDELSDHGLEIIAIAMPYDPPSHVMQTISEKQIPYPTVIDIEGKAALAFGGISATPTSFLIAADGTIASQITGQMDIPKLRSKIISMLANRHNITGHSPAS